jgi:hypothetical protein
VNRICECNIKDIKAGGEYEKKARKQEKLNIFIKLKGIIWVLRHITF